MRLPIIAINSNLGPSLPHFRDIAGFLLRRATTTLFHPLWGVPLAVFGAPRSENLKLINHVITLKLTQLIWPRYINVTDGRTDGRRTIRHRALNTSKHSVERTPLQSRGLPLPIFSGVIRIPAILPISPLEFH